MKSEIEGGDKNWNALEASLSQFSDDFMDEGREQPPMQERESFE